MTEINPVRNLKFQSKQQNKLLGVEKWMIV